LSAFDKDIYFWKEKGLTLWYSIYTVEKDKYFPPSDWKNRFRETMYGDIKLSQETGHDATLSQRVFLWQGEEVSQEDYFSKCLNLFKKWEEACFKKQEECQERALATFKEKGFFNSLVFSGWSSWGTNEFNINYKVEGITTTLTFKYEMNEEGLCFKEEHEFFSH
jgi:hypothetical protein